MPAPEALTLRAKVLLLLCLAVLAAATVHRLWLAEPAGDYVVLSGSTMGTTFDVKVADGDLDAGGLRALADQVEAALDRVEGLMSTYDPASEVSRFNAHLATTPFAISGETLLVLRASQEIARLSGGAFDVTVGPLVKAWGFGATDRPLASPEPGELAALRARVGHRLLELDEAGSTLRKARPDLEIDLSAVAKGYGVDHVAHALEALGHRNYLVEVGGELRAAGVKRDGSAWRVAIERPESELRVVHEVIELRDTSLATSGDYRNWYEENGVRISHTIDPRLGGPIRHRLASVSVLHAEAMYADALATALNVLGPDAGYDLALREGLAAYFIVRDTDGSFTSRATPAFEQVLQQTRAAEGR